MTESLSNPRTLGVDIDGVIWSPYGIAAAEINRLTGLNITLEDMVEYDSFHHIAGTDVAHQGFAKACADPTTVMERELYPGVAEALQTLHHMGISIHFITHNYDPNRMRAPLGRWLDEVLQIPFGLSLTKTGSKMPIMRRIGAFGLIDDRPDTLVEARENGFWAATYVQQWNELLLSERGDINGFYHWRDVPVILNHEMALTA